MNLSFKERFKINFQNLGYEHSRTVDRMWRQNRRQVTPTCVGVDINRNFGYSWRAATIFQPVKDFKYFNSIF